MELNMEFMLQKNGNLLLNEITNSNSEMLKEVKNVLKLEKNKDSNYISLYDVSELLKVLCTNYDNIFSKYNRQFKSIVKENFGDYCGIVIYEFKYKDKILEIGFNYSDEDYDEICFLKENSSLKVVKSKSLYTEEICDVLSDGLSELYEELIKYEDFKDNSNAKDNIKLFNSNFEANINQYGVKIFMKSCCGSVSNFDFFSPSYENKYYLKSNSKILSFVCKGKETEFLKRTFVKISDCPIWSQSLLQEIRKNELEKVEIKNDIKVRKLKKNN